MKLKHLKQFTPQTLALIWDDGHSGVVSLKTLRDSCPCASCKGETVLLRTYVPPSPSVETAGRYELAGAEMVGGYAIKFSWRDAHATGLYTWELLRSLCECANCKKVAD